MNIFNSLGSNYNFNFVLKALFLEDNGKYKKELEGYLSGKFNGKALLTYKGRQALEIALRILNLPKDSLAAINGFTCFAVYKAIVDAGLKPAYIDIADGNLNFSPQQLEQSLQKNPKIKVVIIQNTLGYPAEVEKIAQICKANNIILIEDLAHGVGGEFGDFVALSFSQDKLIDAVSGGALIVRNKNYRSKIPADMEQKDSVKDRFYPLFTYLIRNTYQFGLGKIIHAVLKSFNLLSSPMASQNGIALWSSKLAQEQLGNLESNLDHRRKIAAVYSQNIDKKILFEKLVKNITVSTNLRFPIFVDNRQGLINFLKKESIFVSDIWYDAPIAPKKYMNQTDYNGECPNSEKISEKILNLPTHRNVTEKDAGKISKFINLWLNQK